MIPGCACMSATAGGSSGSRRYSVVVAGTVAEWSAWTGMDFARSGDVVVPARCVPVHVSLEQDHAVYVEPNLWVHHRV